MLKSKASVRYRLGGPHCDACDHFVEGADDAMGTCKLVGGPIGEDMVCDLFEREPGTGMDYTETAGVR